MSTVDRPTPAAGTLPTLVAGQRLDQPTFHARYEAMPPNIRAELVGGVVYMPSPLSFDHGDTDHNVAGWLYLYKCATPGVGGAMGATTILGDDSEPQPDQQLRIDEARGGLSRIVDGYVTGPPELLVEVARTSRKFDLGPKKRDYEKAGVPEYVVVGLDPDEVRWFILQGGVYEEKALDPDGLFRSEVFPGLWLDPRALLDEDLAALNAALNRGLATPEHAAFVARLGGAAG